MSSVTQKIPSPIVTGDNHPLLKNETMGIGPTLLFAALVLAGLGYIGYQLVHDVVASKTAVPWVLLFIALLIALGFEFVNGFHDTANAVATVIYTRSLAPQWAVVWSGFWNFMGVLTASGAVAWGIVALLPVELILQVNSSSGMAMVFALLAAAILWNLGTWWLGLPASSSHTLIGSIIGVGLANQFLAPNGAVTSGVDWDKAKDTGLALLCGPAIGFFVAAALLLVMKMVFPFKKLYEEPDPNRPPPWPIRIALIITCTLVSFFHGSNDGQKGMGLIMLILVGVVPAAFALNRTPDPKLMDSFRSSATAAVTMLESKFPGQIPFTDAEKIVDEAVRKKAWTPQVGQALSTYIKKVSSGIGEYESLANVPTENVGNVRNEMYVIGEALKLIDKKKLAGLSADEIKPIKKFHGSVDSATRYIPDWVKVGVALALGLGTMIGWRRIVITVGEKIGKDHLTYGQGVAAETTAAGMIFASDMLGLPASTTHVLSSGIAGTMMASGSGLQWGTVRSIALAWVLTLPASALLAGVLFAVFRAIF